MRIGLEPRWCPRHAELRARGRVDEGQPDPEVRAPEYPVGLVEQKLGERLVGLVVGEGEGGGQVLDDRALELPGDEGRDHEPAVARSAKAR